MTTLRTARHSTNGLVFVGYVLLTVTPHTKPQRNSVNDNIGLYQKPALKTKFGERAFSYAGPAAWNSLPKYIQMDLNTNRFKKLLKTYLFASSF